MMLDIIRESGPIELEGQLDVPVPRAVDAGKRLSRGTRQRIRTRAKVDERTADTMKALNALAGKSTDFVEYSELGPFSSAVHAHVRGLVSRRAPPPRLCPQEAALELLGEDVFGYQSEDVPSNTVPFAREKVAWPDRGQSARDLAGYLPPALRLQFEGVQDAWVRQSSEVRAERRVGEKPRAHMDATLRQDAREYRAFVGEGLRRGLFDLKRQVTERIGIFFVGKKDGNIRLVCDCRRSNTWFTEPPRTRLFSSGGFSEVDAFSNWFPKLWWI